MPPRTPQQYRDTERQAPPPRTPPATLQHQHPRTGGKTPRSAFKRPSETVETCLSCKRLQLENEELRLKIEELIENKVAEQPRPGKVNSLLADRFQASRRKTASSCAAYLLNVFYTTTELVGRNLTGANGKIAIDKEILESIINFTMAYHKDSTESIIRVGLRNKLSAIQSRSARNNIQ
ncbi:uncharacterized protein LOC114576111 [Exaiptasia diaphana]|uniref:BEN domain-containing protein n=1 Tax=Exaiptasia diaphana TaxID=2652724 RepID=A0A913YS30_EXADI|nr:uncharacterized protein LOC114576111 [Exaiptasia diaphana]